MKLNEFEKKQKLDEIEMQHLIGGTGAAALKQFGRRLVRNPLGKATVSDTQAQQGWIDSFVGKAAMALDNAIRGKLVDPTATGAPTPPTPAAAATPAPAAAPKPAATTPTAPAAKPSTLTPQQQLKARLKSGNGIAKNTGTGFANAQAAAAAKGVKNFESKYDKLNAIFESMVLDEAQSIPQFMKSWVEKYTGGKINFHDPAVAQTMNDHINSVAQTYSKDRGKKGLQGLANAVYAIMQSGTSAPTQQPSGPFGQGQTTQGQGMQNQQNMQYPQGMSGPQNMQYPGQGGQQTGFDPYKQVQQLLRYLTAKQKAALAKQLSAATAPVTPKTTP